MYINIMRAMIYKENFEKEIIYIMLILDDIWSAPFHDIETQTAVPYGDLVSLRIYRIKKELRGVHV